MFWGFWVVCVAHICIGIWLFNILFSAIRTVQHSAPWHTYTRACFMYGRCRASAGLCVRVHHHLYLVCLSLAFGLYVHIKRVRGRPYVQVGWAETKVDGLPPASRLPDPAEAFLRNWPAKHEFVFSAKDFENIYVLQGAPRLQSAQNTTAHIIRAPCTTSSL